MQRFRVWAPYATGVDLVLPGASPTALVPMERQAGGWWRCVVEGAGHGTDYAFSLDGGRGFTPLGATTPLKFSWWKGARPGLFTYNDPAQAKTGVVDFDWVKVKPEPKQ